MDSDKVTDQFINDILNLAQKYNIHEYEFKNILCNVIGWGIPISMDEEYIREMLREMYKLFLEIKQVKIETLRKRRKKSS
jgi:replication initiation and membrane attachment protein DnaB